MKKHTFKKVLLIFFKTLTEITISNWELEEKTYLSINNLFCPPLVFGRMKGHKTIMLWLESKLKAVTHSTVEFQLQS